VMLRKKVGGHRRTNIRPDEEPDETYYRRGRTSENASVA